MLLWYTDVCRKSKSSLFVAYFFETEIFLLDLLDLMELNLKLQSSCGLLKQFFYICRLNSVAALNRGTLLEH